MPLEIHSDPHEEPQADISLLRQFQTASFSFRLEESSVVSIEQRRKPLTSRAILDQKNLSLSVIRCWCDRRPGKGCHARSRVTLSPGPCSLSGGQEAHLLRCIPTHFSLLSPLPAAELVPWTSCALKGCSRIQESPP